MLVRSATHSVTQSTCRHIITFLGHLFSWSLQHGVVPANMKSAYVTPIVKKAGMDPMDVKSYSPISNLSVLSKLLERFVSKQLCEILDG